MPLAEQRVGICGSLLGSDRSRCLDVPNGPTTGRPAHADLRAARPFVVGVPEPLYSSIEADRIEIRAVHSSSSGPIAPIDLGSDDPFEAYVPRSLGQAPTGTL
jgi:hypothetical protein